MKMKKQIIIGIMILLAMSLLPNISKAADISRFESKSGGTLWNNVTISRAYQECYDLRELSAESTLGNNSLDPHLTLNKDWGAVAYLAISPYGGVSSVYSQTTTGNLTGVQDFGKADAKFEFTSSLLTGAKDNTNITNLINNIGTKYVEELAEDAWTNIENSKGMALAETRGYKNSSQNWNNAYPVKARVGVCGFYSSGSGSWYYDGQGSKSSSVFFRPTIWN